MRLEVPHWLPGLLVGGAISVCFATGVRTAGASDWLFAPNVCVHTPDAAQHVRPDLVAAPGGLVATAWMDDHTGQFHVYFSQSTDSGFTWSTPQEVDGRTTGTTSRLPSLTRSPSGTPILAWEDDRLGAYNVYVSRRDPTSGAWGSAIKVNTAGSPPNATGTMHPTVDVYNDQRWFVAWTDWREGTLPQIYMRSTLDGGQNWNFERRVSDEIGVQPETEDACLVVDRNSPSSAVQVHCVATTYRGPSPENLFPNVYYFRSDNGGGTWARGTQVNDISDGYQVVSSRALVLLANGNLVCGWSSDEIGVASFRTSISADLGDNWNPSTQVNQSSDFGTGTFPTLSAVGNQVFGAYDLFDGDDLNCYMRVSVDGALSWTEPPVRIDDDTSGAAGGNTVIAAASATDVYTAWQDTRPGLGPWQIYAAWGYRPTNAVASSSSISAFAFPNPSRLDQEVRLVVPSAAGTPASLASWTIVAADGRVVRSLDAAARGADGEPLHWNGRDALGRPVPAGVYWARRGTQEGSIAIVRVR